MLGLPRPGTQDLPHLGAQALHRKRLPDEVHPFVEDPVAGDNVG